MHIYKGIWGQLYREDRLAFQRAVGVFSAEKGARDKSGSIEKEWREGSLEGRRAFGFRSSSSLDAA